ncbi:Ig-like domain-containing domain [Pontibacter oryzae]|uniref:SbsA Ig-like domain-containing protein n=1 Tax=Pontibacter oryzae TaxID=2304593 RepID=A0A399S7T6_9BACT|nr:Ig-like domain-containing domain [Pontibacter oryzae]RIJ37635.1 hypothetical protein D1627_11060 [Pontibacter oryzae]
MKLLKTVVTAGILASMASCATQNPPQGGPKDETAPTLISSNPKDQQLNVDTRTVTLTFDEEVQQNTLSKQLLITPNINNPYQVKTNRNELTLEFEKPLEDSTTYTFNFREGITDITEKNKAQGLMLSFSTGTFIDSSKVSGQVINLLMQTPEKDAVVALYQAEDTLSVRKNRPYYLTTTDAQGNFSLKNIKEGSYRMYALVDKNGNTYYDSEEERIAYLTAPIPITPQTDTIRLQTIRIDTKKPILLAREKYSDRFTGNYNEGIQEIKARTIDSKDTLITKLATDGRSVELFKSPKFNGGKVLLTAVDSAGLTALDTLEIAFEGKRSQRVKGAQIKVINTTANGNYRVGQQVAIELQTPVNIKGNSPIKLISDSTILKELKYPEEISIDKTNTELRFVLPQLNSRIRQVIVQLDSTAIQPIEGEPLAFPQLQIGIAEGRGTGSLSGIITTNYESYTLQLLNSEYKVVEEQRGQKTFRFKNISPGNYYIRVLIDANKSGRWDKGDPEFKQAPEPVFIVPNAIEVRANWEIEDLKLTF